LLLSDLRSTQLLAQASSPGWQLAEHVPAEQARAPLHFTPHPPQLPLSTLVGMHAPLQNDWYDGQAQTPFEQICPPVHWLFWQDTGGVAPSTLGEELSAPGDAPSAPREELSTNSMIPPASSNEASSDEGPVGAGVEKGDTSLLPQPAARARAMVITNRRLVPCIRTADFISRLPS
jgi:hypothetical protein